MKEVRFTVPGEPRPKGRPRFSVRKGKDGKSFISTRTPEDTVIYENLVRLEYERQCGGFFFEKETPVEMTITAYYSIPKSTSKKKADMMRNCQIRPTTRRGDIDNLVKIVMDACNRVAYYDDSQVVDIHCSKYYSDIPNTDVTIREVGQ